GQLENLTQLDLRSNQLKELPSEIVQLQNLTQLDLRSNQLKELPSEIGQLENLTQLDLRSNQLKELPSEIVQLQNLNQLDLYANQFSTLPSVIRELKKLEKFDLSANPLPIPPEILGPTNDWQSIDNLDAIFDFYYALANIPESDPLYEAKLLIVGEGGAGKTSLAKKLLDPDYELQKDEQSTEGIEVIRWEFSHPHGCDLRLNIWDFGGQEIYHATHQFFLTKRSLYVLVADTREENTDFYYWLRIVELLSDNSPILIVKNEKQDRQCEIDDRALRGEFTNLKEILATNLADNRGLEDIKIAIQQYASRLEHIGNPLPGKWVRIRAVLENYAQNRNYISLEEYLDLCRENGFSDKKRMLAVSQYLHDLGVCLHFQNVKLLRKTVILKPEWATAAVYKVLDTETVKSDCGRFSDDDLETIWDEGDTAEMRDELLQLMMEFELCYEIPHCKGRYIAPQLLQKGQPDYDWEEEENLILRYFYEFKPKDILPRFIVATHESIEEARPLNPPSVGDFPDSPPRIGGRGGETRSHNTVEEKQLISQSKASPLNPPSVGDFPDSPPRIGGRGGETHQLVWKHGVILTNGYARAEVIEEDRYHKAEIKIRISGFDKRRLLNNIAYELEKIQNGYDRLQYDVLIPCNCPVCKGSQNPHTYKLKDLERRLYNKRYEVECEKSYIMVNVRSLLDDVREPQFSREETEMGFKDDSFLRRSLVARDPSREKHKMRLTAELEIPQPMSEKTTINNNFGDGDQFVAETMEVTKIGTQNNYASDLTQAAKDIKSLLDQLSHDYDISTPTGQMMVGAKAVEAIENDPTLKQRVVAMLQGLGETAIEELIEHPAAKICLAGAKGFIKGEAD
ncbi:MAG: COR domain-containing protein, partial [Cyanobacteria bacterium P01_E01_bin.42]